MGRKRPIFFFYKRLTRDRELVKHNAIYIDKFCRQAFLTCIYHHRALERQAIAATALHRGTVIIDMLALMEGRVTMWVTELLHVSGMAQQFGFSYVESAVIVRLAGTARYRIHHTIIDTTAGGAELHIVVQYGLTLAI